MSQDISKHILVVEDEKSLGLLLKENLRNIGYRVKLCYDGEEGWQAFDTERFDLCLFDINMPKKNGYELAELVRQKNNEVPIVFLTANTEEADKLHGYEIGADEYITKPFSMNELNARIKAVLKRSRPMAEQHLGISESYQAGKSTFDIANHIVYIAGEEKKLSGTEISLLKLFLKNTNQLIPRNKILLQIWGRDDFYTARNLDVYINKLRKILKADEHLEIVNIHGAGFKLNEKSM